MSVRLIILVSDLLGALIINNIIKFTIDIKYKKRKCWMSPCLEKGHGTTPDN